MRAKVLIGVLSLTLLGLTQTGCVGAVATGAAVGGVVAAEERTIGEAIDDTSLDLRINEAIFSADEKLFHRVSVTVYRGRVMLTGLVDTDRQKKIAGDLALGVQGVRALFNEMQVGKEHTFQGLKSYATDVRITSTIRAQMLGHEQIDEFNFSVTTENSVVYLMGLSRSELEREYVHQIAANVPGVRQVISHIEVAQTIEAPIMMEGGFGLDRYENDEIGLGEKPAE